MLEQVGQVPSSGLKELLADIREQSLRCDKDISDLDIDVADDRIRSIRYQHSPGRRDS